jgi:hypothetical protein
MFTKFPATIEKSNVNDDGTFSLILDISGLDGDESFENLKTDPLIPFEKVKIDRENKTLELVTSEIPSVWKGEEILLKFGIPSDEG